VIYGKGTATAPAGADIVHVDTSQEMRDAVYDRVAQYDICIAAAAVGDWMPKEKAQSKITTHGAESLTIELVPTPKIIDGIKAASPDIYLVAFRALSGLAEEELIENAYQRMQKASADLIAVNDTAKKGVGFESDTNELFLINRAREIEHIPVMQKVDAAKVLMRRIAEEIA
jgi:phosphopantothenoylcysteine decarboxylase/phosphopantothenate--cysteine ligase